MILKKRIQPFDEFSKIASENWDRCTKLMHHIIDHNKQESFNFYIETEVFPNGVEWDEFYDFCLNHQEEILDNI